MLRFAATIEMGKRNMRGGEREEPQRVREGRPRGVLARIGSVLVKLRGKLGDREAPEKAGPEG